MGFTTKKQSQHDLLNKKKLILAVVFGTFFFIVDIVLMVSDPVLIIAKYCTRVANGSFVQEALSQEFESVYLEAYLFNVTNAYQFQQGLDSKLKVEEVGPFTYQEIRTNDELEFDFDMELIRYSPNIQPRFLAERSVANPEDVNITMPNIAMLSFASELSSYGYLPRMGYNLLTSRLGSKAMVHMSAKDYLWGYDEPLIRLGHTIMPGLVNFDKLGILDRLYDKKAKFLFEVSARAEDKFSIKAVNGSRGLDKWGYNDPKKRTVCNSFTNTYEGIGYPPEMTSDRSIRIYRTILCRFLELDYHGTIMTTYGVEGMEYMISNRTYQKNEETECLCSNGNCLEGTSDLSPCFLGLPIIMSNAHFMHADPKLYEHIEGIRPDESKHGSSFVMESRIGMVLDTKFSVQVNILMRDVSFNSETRRFSDMVVPIVYFTIAQPPLASKQLRNLTLLYFTGPQLLLAVQTILGVLALVLLAYAAKLVYWHSICSRKDRIRLHSSVRQKTSTEKPLMRTYYERQINFLSF